MTDLLTAPLDDTEPLPPRARRRLVTPVTASLTAVLIAAGGFIAGVEVQKHQGGSAAAATPGAAAAARGGFGPGAGRFGGGQGDGGAAPTIGQVANKRGSTLYVTDTSGNTVRVKTKGAKVTRTASTSAGAVHPGDTVIVQGTKHSDGTVSATQVTATQKGAGALGGLGGGGGFGGGGGGQAGGQAGGGSGGAGPQIVAPAP